MKNKILISTVLLASSASVQNVEAQDNSSKKNILFIAVDDLKPLLGCYGDKLAITPNIDRLASMGSVFSSAYCQQAISGPSRASLLTGMTPDHTKVWDLKTPIRSVNPDVVTLPQYFKDNGYESVGIGKIYDPRSVDKKSDKASWSKPYINSDDYLNPEYGKPALSQYQSKETKKAFRKYREEAVSQGLKGGAINNYASDRIKPSTECVEIPDNAYTDGATALGAAQFIDAYNLDKPFFFAVGFKKPHLPFVAPKKYWDLYERADMPLAEFTEVAANSPSFAYHQSGELVNYTDIPHVTSFSDIKNTIVSDEKAKELIHGYYAAISYMDAQLGLVLDALDKKGLKENTIIVLWGDHGWHLGDHGLWNKHSNFEQATRVPLIVVDPTEKPKVITQPVEFLGIYPTLCKMVGLKEPAHLDGISFYNLIQGNLATNEQHYAVSQYPRTNKMGYSIRDNRYRYTVWVDWSNKKTNTEKRLAVELYDYTEDPLETVNVADDPRYKEVAQQMEAYWQENIQRRLNN